MLGPSQTQICGVLAMMIRPCKPRDLSYLPLEIVDAQFVRSTPLGSRPPPPSRNALAIMGLEELKQRIHNFRMPIRNPRLLIAVKMVYLFTPVVLGYGVMQLVIPDPEELKKAMSPPSEAAAALTKHQKDGLRDVLEPARARHAQAQAQR